MVNCDVLFTLFGTFYSPNNATVLAWFLLTFSKWIVTQRSNQIIITIHNNKLCALPCPFFFFIFVLFFYTFCCSIMQVRNAILFNYLRNLGMVGPISTIVTDHHHFIVLFFMIVVDLFCYLCYCKPPISLF